MMGLPWIELHTNLPTHPKSIRLAVALGRKMAWAHMAQLWLWCAEHCPDGLFSSDDTDVIELAAGWDGDRGAFVKAAIKAGFLDDSQTGAIVAHGWQERAFAHVAKLERDAERQRERRARITERFSRRHDDKQKASDGRHADVTRTSQHGPRESQGNSNPNPNPDSYKEKKEDLSASADPIAPETKSLAADSNRRVFGYWAQVMGHPRAAYDEKRRKLIANARKHYSEPECLDAIDGCRASPFHMGENPDGTKHDGLDLIFRDAAHIDKFIAMKKSPPKPSRSGALKMRDMDWTQPPKLTPEGELAFD